MKNFSDKQLNFKDKTRIYSHQDDPLIKNILGNDINDVDLEEWYESYGYSMAA